jgi:hypothetical protein
VLTFHTALLLLLCRWQEPQLPEQCKREPTVAVQHSQPTTAVKDVTFCLVAVYSADLMRVFADKAATVQLKHCYSHYALANERVVVAVADLQARQVLKLDSEQHDSTTMIGIHSCAVIQL